MEASLWKEDFTYMKFGRSYTLRLPRRWQYWGLHKGNSWWKICDIGLGQMTQWTRYSSSSTTTSSTMSTSMTPGFSKSQKCLHQKSNRKLLAKKTRRWPPKKIHYFQDPYQILPGQLQPPWSSHRLEVNQSQPIFQPLPSTSSSHASLSMKYGALH